MRDIRTHEAAIDPSGNGLSWWQLYDSIQPGTSGLAYRMAWNRQHSRWTVDETIAKQTIYDRPGGPGGANNVIVGCIFLPGPRRFEIVRSRTSYIARPSSAIAAGATEEVTIYLKTSAANWIASSYTVEATDVQMVGADSIVADARLTIDWEPFSPLPSVAPFGQYIIRTASCGAVSW